MDYRILIALLVTFLCMSTGTNAREIDRFTEQQNQSENWLLGTTKRFDTFQSFFLERGGEAVFQSGYLYDLEKENWLSFAEAKEVAAELTPILNQEDILVDISKAALVEFVNIDLSNSKRYALLFFDTPIEADGTYMFVGADNDVFNVLLRAGFEKRKLAANLIKKNIDVTGYLIQIPKVGYKPQTF
ncbi:MAG: hypothetical protein VX100_19365 [Pseudomonadota bacterium]|nr:hypothetical protein [Pseudomonadota bacterium]